MFIFNTHEAGNVALVPVITVDPVLIVTAVKAVPENDKLPNTIVVVVLNDTDASNVQFWKAEALNVVTPVKLALVNPVHPWKADNASVITLDGNVILINPVHPKNADELIIVKPVAGKLMVRNPVSP